MWEKNAQDCSEDYEGELWALSKRSVTGDIYLHIYVV
jgi:hypothetical protein